MFKTMICAKDLELIALREIHSLPGGEYAAHVEVAPLNDDWSLIVTMRDGADPDRIQNAASRTVGRLKQRYSLRVDW
jgi:hypothetical protein